MDYKEIFNKNYQDAIARHGCPPENKFQFIGADIFDFTTYDNNIDEFLAKCMLEVCECILNKTTFEYMDSSLEKYLNYLTMVNMPFLQGKVDWGTSIRGAWFDEYGDHLHKSETYFISLDFEIPKKEINNFIKQLIEWAQEN